MFNEPSGKFEEMEEKATFSDRHVLRFARSPSNETGSRGARLNFRRACTRMRWCGFESMGKNLRSAEGGELELREN
jgi:hypothetical protein